MYRADRVVVEWSVRYSSTIDPKTITGRVESGRVNVVPEEKALRIYLQDKDLTSPCPPLELQQAMSNVCGILDSGHVTILNWILMENDLSTIDTGMRRHGFPRDVGDFALLDHLNHQGTKYSYPLDSHGLIERCRSIAIL